MMVLALMPMTAVPVTTAWDKLDHALAFFTLALLAEQAFPGWPFWRGLTLGLLAYGVGIEIAQGFTPDREASLLDMAADGIGIAIYGAVRQLTAAWVRTATVGGR
ncbi:MAG: VanZ family protein [Candidatus Competibacteraceae bacterium]|nr:VanZ family protein [Candidatus Competibacteraceae bacterium]